MIQSFQGKFLPKFLTALLLAGCILSCEQPVNRPPIPLPETPLSERALIPRPRAMQASQSAFGLDRNTGIYAQGQSGLEGVAAFLMRSITERTGIELALNPGKDHPAHNGIYFRESGDLSGEAYELRIGPDSILLAAGTPEGAFRGVQTLRQLLPAASNDTLAAYPIWVIPGGSIEDRPEYGYRGAMLDVSRHFFSVGDVKKFLDVMAYYKLNALHLHLTDDQGWRIEIKSWPRLAAVGGQTEVGGGPGGFYTQEQYAELVAYAAGRFITIIPEVDMPGHTNAASVAYPVLNGNGKTPEPYTGTQVGFSTLDARKDTVYQFIDDVVREISALTPGPWFHIGGDESHVTKPADYKYFIERVVPIVRKHGKIPIGWDEIATAQLEGEAVAQFWADAENAERAVAQGMKILMSPARKAYLDMQYDSISRFGLHWAAYIPVDSAYAWSPASYAGGISREHILGIEAPLWSETITEMAELEYLAFPRLPGYAEIGWTPDSLRNWEEYKVRLARQVPYFRRMDIRFYPSPRVPWNEPDSLLPWKGDGR